MELMTLPKLERRITIAGGKQFNEKYPASFAHFGPEDLSAFGQNYHQVEVTKTNLLFDLARNWSLIIDQSMILELLYLLSQR